MSFIRRLAIAVLLLSAGMLGQGAPIPPPIRQGATLPATCDPASGNPQTKLFYKNTDPVGLYVCTATDTWSASAGGGTGDVTQSGSVSVNQLLAVAGNKQIKGVPNTSIDPVTGAITVPSCAGCAGGGATALTSIYGSSTPLVVKDFLSDFFGGAPSYAYDPATWYLTDTSQLVFSYTQGIGDAFETYSLSDIPAGGSVSNGASYGVYHVKSLTGNINLTDGEVAGVFSSVFWEDLVTMTTVTPDTIADFMAGGNGTISGNGGPVKRLAGFSAMNMRNGYGFTTIPITSDGFSAGFDCWGQGYAPGSTEGTAYCVHSDGGDDYLGPGTHTFKGTTVVDEIVGTAQAADATCSGSIYWIMPVAGSTNKWRKCQNGSVSDLDTSGGMTNPMTTTGDIIYASDNSGTPARLAGNTAATDKVLVSRGDGAAAIAPTLSNAPALAGTNFTGIPWSAISAGNKAIGTYYLDQSEIAAPANPGANTCRQYVDSTTHKMTFIDSTGASCSPSPVSPSGTGWVHVTSGVQDGTASTPTASDVAALPLHGTADTAATAALVTSATANPASAGVVKLANGDKACWRKADNSGDLCFFLNSSNQLEAEAPIKTPAGASNMASYNNSSPATGDFWTDLTNLFFRISGSTKTVAWTDSSITGTSGGLSGSSLTGAITNSGNATTLATPYRTRTCEIHIWGSGTSQALQATDDEPASCRNKLGVTITITAVECWANAGTTTTLDVVVTGGSTILTSAVTCGNGSFAAASLSGTPTLTNNGTLDVNIGVADASTTNVRAVITYTVPAS